MLRTRTDLMRLAFYTALGLFPNACGSRTEDNADTLGRATETKASASTGATALPAATVASDATSPSPGDTSPHSNPVVTAGTFPIGAVTAPNPVSTTTPAVTVLAPFSTAHNPTHDEDGGPSVAVEVDSGTTVPVTDVGVGVTDCNSAALDPVTQLAQCDNGVLHRPNNAQCTSQLPRDPADIPVLPPEFEGGTCSVDTDCTESAHGFCDFPGGQAPAMQCEYGCVTDDECGAGFACLCGDPVGKCVAATCRADADCDDGLLCATWVNPNGVGCPTTTFLSCQSATDTCATDQDCPQENFGSYCSGERGIRSCVSIPGLACGRPFLVLGHERLADSIVGADWCGAALSIAAAHLQPEQRQLLGQRWTDVALMEHASIAAFARFTLQLLHVGAPSALVVAAQQAMLDETAHARACFSVASAFLGHAVSAGALPIDHALDVTSLPEMVRLVIREGCVGETVAALEAAEAWAYTAVPEIKNVLAKIRVDELSHAELAWQFVRWALATGDAQVREAAEHEFAAIASEIAVTAPSAEGFDTLPFGLVPADLRGQLRGAALRDVVLPCSVAVLRASAKTGREAVGTAAMLTV